MTLKQEADHVQHARSPKNHHERQQLYRNNKRWGRPN